jgi:hypothetical protein
VGAKHDCHGKSEAQSEQRSKNSCRFPNIELRLDIQTEKKAGINLHLLFSPEDSQHIGNIERFLSRLTFSYLNRPYECT